MHAFESFHLDKCPRTDSQRVRDRRRVSGVWDSRRHSFWWRINITKHVGTRVRRNVGILLYYTYFVITRHCGALASIVILITYLNISFAVVEIESSFSGKVPTDKLAEIVVPTYVQYRNTVKCVVGRYVHLHSGRAFKLNLPVALNPPDGLVTPHDDKMSNAGLHTKLNTLGPVRCDNWILVESADGWSHLSVSLAKVVISSSPHNILLPLHFVRKIKQLRRDDKST